jgi:hypothetical protein
VSKKIKMQVRGNLNKGDVGVHCDDAVNGLIHVETRGVAHKPVNLPRVHKWGSDGFSSDCGEHGAKRGTRKSKG